MALTHLLDTSVFSQPIKDRPSAAVLDRWSALGDSAVCTSAICFAEVRQGLEMRQSENYWRRFNELLNQRYVVMAFDAIVAEHFGRIASHARETGTPRPAMDLLIAATALRHKLKVATLNAKDFSGIPGLEVEDWTA